MFDRVPNTPLCYVDSGLDFSDGKKCFRYMVNDSHSVLRYVLNKRSFMFQFVYGQIRRAVKIHVMNFNETSNLCKLLLGCKFIRL